MTLTNLILGFIFGVGFGFFIQRSGFCLAQGLAEIFMGRGKRFLSLYLAVLMISAAGFLVSGWASPELGLKTIGQLRGLGFYNLLAGIIFGAGILLCGGCILGTLRQLGEGNLSFLITFLSIIPGMFIVVYLINPLLEHSYEIRDLLLHGLLKVPAWYCSVPLITGTAIWFYKCRK